MLNEIRTDKARIIGALAVRLERDAARVAVIGFYAVRQRRLAASSWAERMKKIQANKKKHAPAGT